MIRRKGVIKMCIIEFFDRLVDVIDYHQWIANLCGIFISAGVAIYVMNKNHADGNEKERKKQEISDNIQFRKAVERIQETTLITGSHYEAMKEVNINDAGDSTISSLIKQIEEIERNMKDNKNLPFYDELKYSKIIAVSSMILEKTFVINLFLTTKDRIMISQRNVIVRNSLKEISDIGEKFLIKEDFKFIKFEDLIK